MPRRHTSILDTLKTLPILTRHEAAEAEHIIADAYQRLARRIKAERVQVSDRVVQHVAGKPIFTD
jgi:hypothetical protein